VTTILYLRFSWARVVVAAAAVRGMAFRRSRRFILSPWVWSRRVYRATGAKAPSIWRLERGAEAPLFHGGACDRDEVVGEG